MNKLPVLGLMLGDVTGIGPEVTLKALAAEAAADDCQYLLICDEKVLSRLNEKLSLKLPLKKFTGYGDSGKFFVCNPLAEALPEILPAGSPLAASASVAWLRDGGQRCLRGELDALVTAPVNKKSILDAGHKFVGQTEFLSELAGAPKVLTNSEAFTESVQGLQTALDLDPELNRRLKRKKFGWF
jgi:4-hydroxythreonine-4-phosphate dehydrogenase